MPPRKLPVRRWLLNIHLYGGLVCCWYLFVYGYTSLGFQHPWMLPKSESALVEWRRGVASQPGVEDLARAERIRDDLDLIGWVLPWTMRRSPAEGMFFELVRPGKHYTIRVDAGDSMVSVSEKSTGWGNVLHAMHGMYPGIPNSRFLRAWGIYTELTTWFVLFAVSSGVYLWLSRAARRRTMLILLSVGLGSSLLFMALLYFQG